MGNVRDPHWDDYEPDFEEIEELERPRDAMVDTAKLSGIEKVLLNRMTLCLDLTKPELMALYQKVRKGLALNLSEEERKQIDPEE